MNFSAQKANAQPRLPANTAFPSVRVVLAVLLGFLAVLLILRQADLSFFNSKEPSKPQVMANLMSDNSKGTQWELIHKESFAHSATVDKIVFNDSNNGWALTWATLFKLSDKGKTWTSVLTNDDTSRSYYGIHFVNANVGFVVGAQKIGDLFTVLILQTSDGGKSWEDRPVDVRGDKEIHKAPALYTVSFCGENSGWAVGGNLILRTADGGNSWHSQEFEVEGKERLVNGKDRLLTISCVSPERAWIGGDGGLLLQTYDGGQTWTKQDVGTKATLTGIRFFGNDGWIVAGGSAEGLLIKSSDQGKTWQRRQLDISAGFFDIFFLGSQGWLAGENGTLLRTTDAGQTWVRQSTPTNEDLTTLFFLSPGEGWVGGEKLTLLHAKNLPTSHPQGAHPDTVASREIKSTSLPTKVASDSFQPEPPSRFRCSRAIDQQFEKVITDKFALYEVNRDYFLQAQFQKNCELVRVDVSPKYFWNDLDPKWKEPGYLVALSEDEYGQLLAKINQIVSLGPVARKGQIGTVTNSTLWLLDRYQNAYVQRRLHDFMGQEDEPNKVSSFSIYFTRSVGGKVWDKKFTTLPNADKRAQLQLDGKWYLVDEKEYNRAVIGERGVFRAAGPVS